MKKTLKVLVLLLAMMLTLVGCSGGGNNGGGEAAPAEETTTPAAALEYAEGTELRVAAGYNSDKTGISFTNADVTGSGTQVQNRELVEVEIVVEDIEQALFGHVGGGTHRKRCRCDDAFSPVISADDSHD